MFALFFVSGGSGLLYEVVWLRMFAAVFGVTLYATSVVVACFMGGLALGSFVIGRVADRTGRGLFLYGACEVGIGLTALILPAAVAASRALYASVYDHIAGSGAALALLRTLTAAALLTLPAALMGGTLPALSRHLSGSGRVPGETAARLYAANTFGAMAGILAAVLWLIPALGGRGANTLCAAVNIAIGCIALALARTERRREAAAAPVAPTRAAVSPQADHGADARAAVLIAGLSGFAALGYQMIWVRGIALNTADTIFSFGATLSAFLAGIALGSRVFARRAFASERARGPDRGARTATRTGWGQLYACQIGIAAFAALSPFVLRAVFSWFASQSAEGALAEVLSRHWLLVLVALSLPTFLMGGTLAITFRLFQRACDAGATGIGRVYAANTVGAIGGSLATGMLLIPAVGMVRALAALIAANLAAAFVAGRRAAPAGPRWTIRLATPAVALLALCVSVIARPRFYERRPGNLTFEQEDPSGVVEVVERDGVRTLYANRIHSWGSTAPPNVDSSKRQGMLPLFIHPRPRRVIEVGLATGAASAPFLLDPRVEELVVVEISPAIVEASRLFDEANGRIAKHSKARVVVDDGRSFIMLSRQKFDVIVLGLFTPYTPWASLLFSRELYLAARDRLEATGLVVQWLPLQQLTPEALRSVLATFAGVFPEVHVWEKAMYLALVGGSTPMALGPHAFERVHATPALRAESERLGFATAAGLLATYFMGPRAVAAFARGGLPNTEDEPRVEWSPAQEHGDRFELLVENLNRLLPSRSLDELPMSAFGESDRQAAGHAFEARGHSLRAAMHEVLREYDRALAGYQRAVALYPDDELAKPQLVKYRKAMDAAARRAGAAP